MTDITLEELAGTAGEAAESAEAASEAAESGESFKELLEFMDDRIGLEKLMFGTTGGDGGDVQAPEDATTDDGEVLLTSESIATLGEQITERVGDVPLSRVVEFARENPDRVDSMIAQQADDD